MEPRDFELSSYHYRIVAMRMTEVAPTRCPNGHPLGPTAVLIGSHPCVRCTGSSHRTWRCRACDASWIWPACAERPEWPEWRGVEP